VSGAQRWQRLLRSRKAWAVVLALGLLARLVRWGVDLPIWGDEAFVGCSLLARDLGGLLEPLEFEMVVPLGWLLPTGWLAAHVGTSTLVLRLPALVAGCAALMLFARVARETLSSGQRRGAIAQLAVAWFGGSYYLIRHSAEIKPYAFDLLAGVLLYGTALRLARGGVARGRAWLAFAAIGVVAVWCSYPAIFVAAGCGAVALWQAWRTAPRIPRDAVSIVPRASPVAGPLAACIAIATSFLAMYFLFGHAQQWSEERIADARHWDDHFLPLAQPWLWPWWLLRELNGNLLAYPNGGPNFGSSATFALCVAGGIAWWRRGRRVELAVLLAPLVPMVIASALRMYPFGGSARIALHLAVPVCLLAASGVAAVAARLSRLSRVSRLRTAARATRIATLALAAFAVGSSVRDVAKPWKTEQDRKSREAFVWFAAQLEPGDHVAVFGRYDGGGSGNNGNNGSDAAPDLRGWRGSSGRLRWYLLQLARERRVALSWAPEPATLAAAPWLVIYRDNEAPFPEPQHEAWRAAMDASFGAPSLERDFDLGPASPDPLTNATRRERLTFVQFARDR
jgi:hypothetical protein